jgi:glucose uptake protein
VTVLLALLLIVAWGTWVPMAYAVGGISQGQRTLYVTIGNLATAAVALLVGGGHLSFGWRGFWLPLAGGIVWTLGNHSAFRAARHIGLARAGGTWAPLNILVSFVWGAALFGELDGFSAARFVALGLALVLVLAGVLLIVRSQEAATPAVVPADPAPKSVAPPARTGQTYRIGLLWAGAAGVLWGSYFVPAQWAKVPSQVSNLPLAVGMFGAGLALALASRDRLVVPPRAAGGLLFAGAVFGIGDVVLLALVSRIGTGAGFTIGQLSLLVNASIGIWVFKVPRPGSRAARSVIAGVIAAGLGGTLIGAIK